MKGKKEVIFANGLCKKNLGLIMSYLWTVRQMEILGWGFSPFPRRKV